ncbi:metallophosphoesterase family protein [Salibacterium aidingense]|uniref:metallophosphoesterase family protein n=1 Tax=Salibacterium aidingense TaxID=384933 RepID=UPI000401F1F9|nr:metallophosphoesterase [Salibacterium aidingense]
MKALLISDSHGSEVELKEVIDRCRGEVDAVFHCGDSELSQSSPILQGVHTVQGNVDKPGEFPEDTAVDIKGIRILVTHGHLYNIKMTHIPLSYRAEEKAARMACFGHSHHPTAFEDHGIIFVNPGSLMQPRTRPEPTYAITEFTKDGAVEVRFYERTTGEEVEDLRASIAEKS